MHTKRGCVSLYTKERKFTLRSRAFENIYFDKSHHILHTCVKVFITHQTSIPATNNAYSLEVVRRKEKLHEDLYFVGGDELKGYHIWSESASLKKSYPYITMFIPH